MCFIDFSDTNMTYSLVEDKLCARRDSSSREDDMSDEFHPDQVCFRTSFITRVIKISIGQMLSDPGALKILAFHVERKCRFVTCSQ